MCDTEAKSYDLFNALLPKIAKALRKDPKEIRYELSTPTDSFFLSNTYYVNLSCNNAIEGNKKKEEETIAIVVKTPPRSEFMQQLLRSDNQFHNEILFYQEYAQGSRDFPRCIYLDEKPPSDSVIVLENIKERGYELCEWKYDVPLEYTLAAMREIGRFHGRGYVMKERQREKFFGIVRKIQETRYDNIPDNKFEEFVNLTATRAIEYLRDQGYDKDFCDKTEVFLENAFHNVMMKSAEPTEPLSTLCHGDFTLNNILFKGQGAGIEAILIDFALMRYGSPTIDLSTFFCLSCPTQVNSKNITHMLRAYYDSLKEYLLMNDILAQDKYSYGAFCDDYKQRGLFGFVIASFYLVTVMGKHTDSAEDVMSMDMREAAKICRASGGEEVSKILAEMLLSLKSFGCLEHVV